MINRGPVGMQEANKHAVGVLEVTLHLTSSVGLCADSTSHPFEHSLKSLIMYDVLWCLVG